MFSIMLAFVILQCICLIDGFGGSVILGSCSCPHLTYLSLHFKHLLSEQFILILQALDMIPHLLRVLLRVAVIARTCHEWLQLCRIEKERDVSIWTGVVCVIWIFCHLGRIATSL